MVCEEMDSKFSWSCLDAKLASIHFSSFWVVVLVIYKNRYRLDAKLASIHISSFWEAGLLIYKNRYLDQDTAMRTIHSIWLL
jgi:hypothetical protein